MNLWFRLLWYVVRTSTRPRLDEPTKLSRLRFRVWPTDLDFSRHMNNGRYLSLMDLGRLDVMIACELWRAVLSYGWTPVASSVQIRFRRELKLFQVFRLETKLIAWESTNVIMEQKFIIVGGERDGQIAAHALFKGGIYDRKERKFVEIAYLMQELGFSTESPPLSPEVEAFLNADQTLKTAGKTAGREIV